MTKELTKNLMCVCMRNGVEIWLESEKLEELKKQLQIKKFIPISGNIINVADIVGIFTPQTMEETAKRKNGQWKCEYGTWHNRGEKCGCWEMKRLAEKTKELQRLYA